tara:strand:+ start:2022 stop:2642 length:621 start_codon:yes stop_codon:yes gene_type:complete
MFTDELSYDGNRISFTFREIATYIDKNTPKDKNKDEVILYGQGAKKKYNDIDNDNGNEDNNNGDDDGDNNDNDNDYLNIDNRDDSGRMTAAFGVENRSCMVEWEELYGKGFRALCSRPSPLSSSSSLPLPLPLPPLQSSSSLSSSSSSLVLKSQVIDVESGPLRIGVDVENYDVKAIHPQLLDNSCHLQGSYCILAPLDANIHAQG